MADKEEKNRIKNSLSIDQVFNFVADLGGEPQMYGGYFVSQTICHNPPGEGSHKLFYYENTRLFKCFTECEGGAFDIFDLTTRVKQVAGEKRAQSNSNGEIIYRDWTLYDSIWYVARYFGIPLEKPEEEGFLGLHMSLKDWDILKRYEEEKEEVEKRIEMQVYDKNILAHYPRPHIAPWENEGITFEVEQECGIAYDPCALGIIIPHFDIYGRLIGIRERTLIKELEDYGKYKPAILQGKMYNHPLGFNLYNLNNSKDNIIKMKKAVVFESEKSCLLSRSYFGAAGDISVATCGSSFTMAQFKLLQGLGVDEIIIAFDRQFQKHGDDEFKRWTKKLEAINDKYKKYVLISFMFDKNNILQYKSSPIDEGKNKFIQLFKERIIL
jgi:hypothetical protein